MAGGGKVQIERLGVFSVVEPEAVRMVKGEWEELEMAVDSGAGETVLKLTDVECVEIREGEARKRGVKYEAADGTLIENEGEKEFVSWTENGAKVKMVAQVADVTKSLLSVRRVVDRGGTVVFKKGYGWIETSAGRKVWLRQKEGMYVVRLWVNRNKPF